MKIYCYDFSDGECKLKIFQSAYFSDTVYGGRLFFCENSVEIPMGWINQVCYPFFSFRELGETQIKSYLKEISKIWGVDMYVYGYDI